MDLLSHVGAVGRSSDHQSYCGRLFAVLEAVAGSAGCSLRDVSARTGLPFSSVHRLAGELEARRYIVRLQRGRYMIGPAAIALGADQSMRALLRAVGHRHLVSLARRCRSDAYLGVFEEDMVTYLVKVSFGRDQRHAIEGLQLEAYCSGLGKVLLAHLSEAERRSYLAGGDFVALTVNTIVEQPALAEELARVRERGWATDLEEMKPGLMCVAVPVYDQDGYVIAAISASRGNGGFDPQRLLEVLPLVRGTAASIAGQIFGGMAEA